MPRGACSQFIKWTLGYSAENLFTHRAPRPRDYRYISDLKGSIVEFHVESCTGLSLRLCPGWFPKAGVWSCSGERVLRRRMEFAFL